MKLKVAEIKLSEFDGQKNINALIDVLGEDGITFEANTWVSVPYNAELSIGEIESLALELARVKLHYIVNKITPES